MYISRSLTVLIVLLAMLGCDKIKYPYGDASTPKNSPAYTEKANVGGGVSKIDGKATK